ncbi:hypothetical protein N7481_009447 [Penicillium waksmanii]|uniref:uncharacterized protein n=1 Tax=Penicillium waksmanii TaxID=69791 RepID=UPI0025480412|nr:uncharacterized protein N7481_009447 [Penicillium waksmanii]KAJ5975740.1 hypothetical protein N7481_009447 [Penicillium waksmanii]
MDQQVPLPIASDLPIFNWEDFHPSTSLSESSHPLLQESATSDINSLLSACSYPLPESYKSRNAQSNTPSPNSDDFAPELAFDLNRTNTNQTHGSKPTTPRPQKRQRDGPKKATPAKSCGASQAAGDSEENPGERRRKQIRMAQRAYRSRQQATVEDLKSHISLLETSMEKMSSAMLSFSAQLVQSGVLRSHTALTANLRDTMKIFLSMASGASLEDGIVVPVNSNKIIDSPPALKGPTVNHPARDIPLHLPMDGFGFYHPNSTIMPCTVTSSEISILEVSGFIERLLLAALYQGHLALCNSSIGLDQLQRPFGIIFSIMRRERLASYFKAELYAHASKKPLDGWEEVPLFRLGGAGTHYPDGCTGASVPHYQRWGTVEDPISLVTADLRKQLEGDWFDLQDLKGYLQDKNVLLVASAGEPTRCSKVQTNINVSRFISTLTSRGVCLGRTPGFQRNDVEEALHISTIV